eukprot:TRINITY_DN40780_c0_g1_i1.p1 TRINITY_DN40780_c0_g1~~TRINITY_DN40780_c0_g1_i1.p1  ORF type:complete len:297 (-),score=91.47 TRINITY_DN40780_c0_g1_i1:79-915(-)
MAIRLWGGKCLLLALLLLEHVLPVLAYGGKKKGKFMAAYPVVFKFVLFWWCVFVFGVMIVYIIDHLMYKKFGAAKVVWNAEHTFRGASRKEYWAQISDPSKWSKQHPIMQTADICMVHCNGSCTDAKEAEAASEEASAELPNPAEPKKKLKPAKWGPLRSGLGMVLRHKAESGPQAGNFFCTRECTQLEEPQDGPFLLIMKTVEAGVGYPFLEDTEISEVELFPAAEDGSIRCKMVGTAEVTSRMFRWWTGLQKSSQEAACAFLESISEEVSSAKKEG